MVKVKVGKKWCSQKSPNSPYRIDVFLRVGSIGNATHSPRTRQFDYFGLDGPRRKRTIPQLAVTRGTDRKSLWLCEPPKSETPRPHRAEQSVRKVEILQNRGNSPSSAGLQTVRRSLQACSGYCASKSKRFPTIPWSFQGQKSPGRAAPMCWIFSAPGAMRCTIHEE